MEKLFAVEFKNEREIRSVVAVLAVTAQEAIEHVKRYQEGRGGLLYTPHVNDVIEINIPPGEEEPIQVLWNQEW